MEAAVTMASHIENSGRKIGREWWRVFPRLCGRQEVCWWNPSSNVAVKQSGSKGGCDGNSIEQEASCNGLWRKKDVYT
jgi:hypothetical protein